MKILKNIHVYFLSLTHALDKVLTDKSFKNLILKKGSIELLEDLQLHVLKHYSVCVKMIDMKYRTENRPQLKAKTVKLLSKLEFLTHPVSFFVKLINTDYRNNTEEAI